MKEKDRFYMEHPTSGVRTMRNYLNDKGYKVGTKHVRRLMRQTGLEEVDDDGPFVVHLCVHHGDVPPAFEECVQVLRGHHEPVDVVLVFWKG